MKIACVFCNEPVRPDDRSVWRRVAGWERPGKAGGSDIVLREPTEGFACARCIALKKAGVDVRQESLL